jgi:hypothetical protein
MDLDGPDEPAPSAIPCDFCAVLNAVTASHINNEEFRHIIIGHHRGRHNNNNDDDSSGGLVRFARGPSQIIERRDRFLPPHGVGSVSRRTTPVPV